MKKKYAAILCCAAVMLAAGCNNGSDNNGSGTAETDAPAGTEATAENGESASVQPTGAAAEYEWGNVRIVGGGYTTGIIFNSGEEGLVYAKTDVGGLYRRDKNTPEWKPLTDRFDINDYTYYGIDGVAVDTRSPNKVYALAGMYGNMKAAVLCSDNYGDDWSITPLEFSAGGNEPHRQANRLELDPNDSSTLYLGSRHDGLWVSHDSGASFQKVESFPTIGNGYTEDGYSFGITAIAFDPASSSDGEPCKTIYIGTGDRVMYVTHDAGATWEELAGAPKAYLANHIYVQGDDVYFVFTSTAAPYAPKKGTLRRYNAVSGEWTDITPDSTGHSWGDIEFDPNDPDTVYAVTMGRYASNEDDIIFRSTDRCATWEPIFSGADDTDRLFTLDYSKAPWLDWGRESAVLGWMIGDFEINPFDSNEIMYGTGATIYHSTNLTDWGKQTINFEVCCEGLEETVINDLCAANSDEIRLYSAMWDIDGFTHRDVDTAPSHMNGDGIMTKSQSISCGWNAPEVAARTGEGTKPLSITTDGGETWKDLYRPDGVGGECGTITVNCDGSIIYWTNKSAAGIYYTKDLGETWTKMDKSLASPKMAADCFEPETLYVYTSTGMYITTDLGASFTKVDQYIPDGCTLTASPEKAGDVWLSTPMGGVYLLTDYGKGEMQRKNIQSAKAFAIGAAKDANSPMTLYAIGTNDDRFGVYRSLDSGDTWERINDDMHQFGSIGDSLAADLRTYGQIYFGTNGRGIICARRIATP